MPTDTYHPETRRWSLGLSWLVACLLLAVGFAWPGSRDSAPTVVASPVGVRTPASENASAGYVSRKIEDLQAGDWVMARDPETGRQARKQVVRTFRKLSDHLRLVTVRNDAGVEQTLPTTDEHPFWSADSRTWLAAAELHAGDEVTLADGSRGTILATGREEHPEGVPVYNFEVADLHTYFVSAPGVGASSSILVHNDCHHPIPKFLGGNQRQTLLSQIDHAVHVEYHQLLSDGLRRRGLPGMGGTRGSTEAWEILFRTNPSDQSNAFDAVLEASRAIDAKHGTRIVQDFWTNLMNGDYQAW